MRAIERLTGDVSHALRSPLQSLFINLEVLRRRVQSGAREAALDRTKVVETEVRRLAALLDAFLIVLRPQSNEAATFDLDAAVARIAPLIEVVAQERRAEFGRSPAGVMVRAPEEALLYAIACAAAAVCDAVTPGGTLRIDSSTASDVVIHVEATSGDGTAADIGRLDAVHTGLALFLADSGGTITLEPVSPTGPRSRLSLRVPRP